MAIIITNITDLQKIGNDPSYPLNGDYELGNDIDASATSGWNGGQGFEPIGSSATPFSGTFNGKNYNIDSLYIHREVSEGVVQYAALFAVIDGAEIKNLNVINCDLLCFKDDAVGGDWESFAAPIVGQALAGSIISNAFASGNVETKYENSTGSNDIIMKIGGFAADSAGAISNCDSSCSVTMYDIRNGAAFISENTGIITNCTSSGTVSATGPVSFPSGDCAGFVYRNFGTISNCSSTGNVTTVDDAGGFVWVNEAGGIIRNSFATGDVTGTTGGSTVSGFCAWDNYGSIEDCYSTGNVEGSDNANGFVYDNESTGVINRCYCTGSVHSLFDDASGFSYTNKGSISNSYSAGNATSDNSEAAGFVKNNSGTINQCYATGNAVCTGGGDDVAAFVEYNSGIIQDCYATGLVQSSDDIGGFLRSNSASGSVTNCYYAGAIVDAGGADIGGFCESNSGTITSCFWDTETSGIATSDGGTGKTTAEMKTCSTFTGVGWDYVTIWEQELNVSYPVFGNRGCYYLGFKGPTIIFD